MTDRRGPSVQIPMRVAIKDMPAFTAAPIWIAIHLAGDLRLDFLRLAAAAAQNFLHRCLAWLDDG